MGFLLRASMWVAMVLEEEEKEWKLERWLPPLTTERRIKEEGSLPIS